MLLAPRLLARDTNIPPPTSTTIDSSTGPADRVRVLACLRERTILSRKGEPVDDDFCRKPDSHLAVVSNGGRLQSTASVVLHNTNNLMPPHCVAQSQLWLPPAKS